MRTRTFHAQVIKHYDSNFPDFFEEHEDKNCIMTDQTDIMILYIYISR